MIRKRSLPNALTVALTFVAALTLPGATPPQTIGESDFQRVVSIGAPSIAPDGKHADKDSHSQIFVIPAGGGAERVVTHGEVDVERFAWRRDGRAFAFAAEDPQVQRTGLRDNHKDATLRVWPVEGHFPHDPVRSADVYHY